jgi:hypothetical protein
MSTQYREFRVRTEQVTRGMNEADVRTILGDPLMSLSDTILIEKCVRPNPSARVFRFVWANDLQQRAERMMGTQPMVTDFIVCFDSGGKVASSKSEMITY